LLSRRYLTNKIETFFGDEVMLLSSPGVASMLVLKKYCHFTLQNVDDNDNKNLTEVAKSIKAETIQTERNMYKVFLKFDINSIAEGFSDALMNLLEELKLDKLSSIMIGKSEIFIPYSFLSSKQGRIIFHYFDV
jgi:hypothetical protein